MVMWIIFQSCQKVSYFKAYYCSFNFDRSFYVSSQVSFSCSDTDLT